MQTFIDMFKNDLSVLSNKLGINIILCSYSLSDSLYRIRLDIVGIDTDKYSKFKDSIILLPYKSVRLDSIGFVFLNIDVSEDDFFGKYNKFKNWLIDGD